MYERLRGGPLGPERFDYLFAQLQATVANASRDRRTRPYKAVNFAPPWSDTTQWPWADRDSGSGEMTGEEMLKTVKSMHRSMGGK